MNRTYLIGGAVLALAVAGGVLHYAEVEPVVVFFVTGAGSAASPG